MAEITVNVRDDIPDALRDQLVRQLEGSSPPIVGNFADLNRLGAVAIANNGPDETFRLAPGVDEDQAKAGAQRVLDEEEAAATPITFEAGPDEDARDKDPLELARTGEVAATATATTTRRAKRDEG